MQSRQLALETAPAPPAAVATESPARRVRAALDIPSLDGLRAFAVMLVFAAHAGLNERVPGNFGVTVFFFLSGYLITTLLRVEHERSGRISLRNFYLRRALRILPPFYLVLLGASLLAAAHLLDGSLQAAAVAAQAVHLSNYWIILHGWWDGRAPGTWIFWSLAVEEHFYLVYPLVYLALLRFVPSRRRQAAVLAGICLLVLLWRCYLVFDLHAIKERTYLATDTRIDSILFGALLAVLANPALEPASVGPRSWWRWLWLPIGTAGLLVSFAVRSPAFQETVRYSLQGVCLVPFFVVAIRDPGWTLFKLLNLRWVKFIGVLSYTIYLVHPTVLYLVHQWSSWGLPVQGVVSLGLTLAFAAAMYKLVEKPCAGLRRRLSRA